MPIYATGRKAKDLYFNGVKIKEAWFVVKDKAEKVYSSKRVPTAWVPREYAVGEQVILNGSVWEAIAPVTGSDQYFQPSSSSYSKRFWKLVGAA